MLVYFLHLSADGHDGTPSPQAAVACFADLAAEGFDQVIVVTPQVTDPQGLELFASQIIPEIERMPVAGR